MPSPTLSEIASRTGVSKFTVSVALRGKPGVSPEVRARVLAQAKRMGYSPDVLANELMSMMRTRRYPTGVKTLAFINTFKNLELMETIPTFQAFLRGAQERAKLAGYRVEEFRIHAPGMTAARLGQILKARGIRGVLVGPRWMNEPEIAFEWEAFSCVLVGEAVYGPGIYRVCNHHTHGSYLALSRLVGLGYRSIGLALEKTFETTRGFDYMLGMDRFRRVNRRRIHLCTYVEATGANWHEERFARWVRREKLDAVVSLAGYPYEIVKATRARGGPGWAYANLDVSASETCAGIDQKCDEIGAAGFVLLQSMLKAGERGPQPSPQIVLVEGAWRDGDTAPRVAAGRTPARKRTGDADGVLARGRFR